MNILKKYDKKYKSVQWSQRTDKVIIITNQQKDEIFNESRKKLLKILEEENPFTLNELKKKVSKDLENDLILLNHIGLITIDEKENPENNIIKLNRDIVVEFQ